MSQRTNTAIARPPFAVDDDNVKYADRQPVSRTRQPREDRNKVSDSMYDAYDNYLEKPGNPSASRDSAHEGIGGGLLAYDMSDSDDDSEDDRPRPAPGKPAPPKIDTRTAAPPVSKNRALFDAAVTNADRDLPSASPSSIAPPAYDSQSPRNRYPDEKNSGAGPSPLSGRNPSPAPSITPPPPAAVNVPIHQMNAPQPKRPILAGANPPGSPVARGPPNGQFAPNPNGPYPGPNNGPYPGPNSNGPYPGPNNGGPFPPGPNGPFPPGRGPPQRGPPLAIQPPHPAQFRPSPSPQTPYGSPGFHMNPCPTPSMEMSTPIEPAFVKPIRAAFIRGDNETEKTNSLMSHESSVPIMRGDKEDPVPLRSGPRLPKVGGARGEGDEFWRRFSMVVKQDKVKPANKKESDWLKSNLRHGKSMSRWVWCMGLFALIIIVGGSVAGWWFTRNNPEHAIPVAIGGGAGETMAATTTAIPTPVGQSKTTKTAKGAAKTTAAGAATGQGGARRRHHAHPRRV